MMDRSSIVFEAIRTALSLFIFFSQKDFKHTKTHHKQKPTNKTKISKQETTKATIFQAQKFLRRWKLFPVLVLFLQLKSFRKKQIKKLAIIWSSVRISTFCKNLFESFLFVRISSYLWSTVRIYFLKSSWKQASV